MLYMIIETFKPDAVEKVYERVQQHGRLLPEGLQYLDSWVAADYSKCYQLMSCDDAELIERWIAHWSDLVTFEIVPLMHSTIAAARFRRSES